MGHNFRNLRAVVHGLIRLVAVAVITAASYLLLEVIPRQIIERRNIERFFQAAVPYSDESVTGEPAEAAQQGIPGLVVGCELLASAGALDGDVDAGSGALVAAVGEGRHSEGSGAVEGGQRVDAGGGDVVDVAGLGRGGPEREAVGADDGLDVAAGPVVLASTTRRWPRPSRW